MNHFVEIISVAIGGGGVVAILNYFLSARKQKSSEFQVLLEERQQDNIRLREEVEVSRAKIEELNLKVNSLMSKVMLLESAHTNMPFPMWLKDMNFVMLSLNPAYEEVFLTPISKTSSDYLGKTDYEVWPKEVADAFRRNDQKALRSRNKAWQGLEKIKLHTEDEGEDWIIVKYVRYVGNTPVGIAGLALPKYLK